MGRWLLGLSLPRFADSNFPGNPPWAWEYQPTIISFRCFSVFLRCWRRSIPAMDITLVEILVARRPLRYEADAKTCQCGFSAPRRFWPVRSWSLNRRGQPSCARLIWMTDKLRTLRIRWTQAQNSCIKRYFVVLVTRVGSTIRVPPLNNTRASTWQCPSSGKRTPLLFLHIAVDWGPR